MSETFKDKRILIVEDEYFIAQDIKRVLHQAGAEVLGPVSTLSEGMCIAEEGRLDAAILDVNLHGQMSYTLAEQLAKSHVPHLFLTGYDDWSLAEPHRDTPRMAKPFQPMILLAALERLLSAEASA
ncbi:response regulator [Sphingobium bisphenolivorans]|uniref:response regulator n=1 Tax=Sphingobium bisphenolivorans TaxID=1335760 RepID=UPI0003B2EEBD|nr:response regulator [Sphingobium bisphenolivorans]